jgi:DNA-binding LacI/PurR family transcriptional regulator
MAIFPLTTVAVPAYKMGRLAAKILIENLCEESQGPSSMYWKPN